MVLTTLYAALALAQTPPVVAPGAPRRLTFGDAEASIPKVSLSLKDATLAEAMARLPKLDYVVDAEAFRGRLVSLSLSDVPLTAALNALAAALDAHWETIDGERVLKKGPGAFRTDANRAGGTRLYVVPNRPELRSTKPGDSPFVMPKDALESLGKARGLFGPEGFRVEPLDPARREEMRKALERLRAGGPQSEALRKALEGIRGPEPTPNAAPQGDEKARREYEAAVEDIARRRRAIEQDRRNGRKLAPAPRADGTGAPTLQVKALKESLTPAQRELARTQGYLKPSDLTPEQRRLAGIPEGAKIEIVIRDAEGTLRIKG